MPIPEAKIREVKDGADLLALCNRYGLELTKKGADYFARCPWHKDDTPSLSITPGKNLFHCFGCGAKGNAIQFVQKMEGLSFPDAFTKVVQKNGKKTVPVAPSPFTAAHQAEHMQATLEKALQHMTAALEGFGCYDRRDEAIRRVFPDYDPAEGDRAKLVLPPDLLEPRGRAQAGVH